MHVVLIGARGSGKSTIGQILAERLGATFVDLDAFVLAQFEQPTVKRLWAELGESAWRDAELAAILELLPDCEHPAGVHDKSAPEHSVIALGGGVPTIPDARTAIRRAAEGNLAVTVYLQTSVETMRRRLAAETGDRPSLTGGDPVEEVEAVLAERDPVYRALADWIISTDDRAPDDVAEEIARRLESARG